MLARIHAILVPLRPVTKPNGQKIPVPPLRTDEDFKLDRVAPKLVAVKRILRDWVELHLASLGEHDDVNALAVRLNAQLRRADLLCQGPSKGSPDRCEATGEQNGIGFLYPIQIDSQQMGTLFVVRSYAGIFCGSDASAYAYEWRGKAWRRFWQSDHVVEAGKPYLPEAIDAVEASWADKKTHARLLLSLGAYWGCASLYHDVRFRLWRTQPDSEKPELLLDEGRLAYLGAGDPPIIGSVGNDDAVVIYSAPSLSPGDFYDAVRRYKVDGDKVERIEPIALSPRSFVEEWLRADWLESKSWTIPSPPPSLEVRHKKFHDKYTPGDYIDQTQHCQNEADSWQVGITFDQDDKPSDNAYFLVRWRPPYRFQMVDVSPRPRADCNEPDADADDWGVPFPIQGWR